MIHIPYWWHASLFEILWFVGGLAAAVLTGLNLRDAWKDNEILADIRADQSIHARHYKMIALSAHGRLASQAFRLVVSILIIFAGAVGCLNANPLRGATTFTGLTVTVALVGISVLTATSSFLDLIRRNQLYKLATGRSPVRAAELRATHLTDQKETS